jgi:DNA-binding sugar fermentation-stimulating protein
VANSGRLAVLFIPGRSVWLAPADETGRKTAVDLKLVGLDSGLVSVDARLPYHLFAEAVRGSQGSLK